jgi:hypothetical protein
MLSPIIGSNRFLLLNILRNRFLVKYFAVHFSVSRCLYLLTVCLVPVVVRRAGILYTQRESTERRDIPIGARVVLELIRARGHFFALVRNRFLNVDRRWTPGGGEEGRTGAAFSLPQGKEVSTK